MTNWLEDHRAQELINFRARFTDEEWIMFRSGRCGWLTEYGTGRDVHCGDSRPHDRIHCNRHTRQARETATASTYGALSVPVAVRSMDISEVP